MAFANGRYATVWQVKPGTGNYTDVRISTSHKGQSGEYETDFSGFVRFIGDAHKNAGKLKERDRIKLNEVSATNTYNKEKNVTYTNFQVYSFDLAESNSGGSGTTRPSAESIVDIPDGITDEELPFN